MRLLVTGDAGFTPAPILIGFESKLYLRNFSNIG